MRTILILDDERVFRRLVVVDALQKRGHRVLEAGRAVEADLLLSSEQPDLPLIDGLLPDTTGVIGSRSSAARAGRHWFFSSPRSGRACVTSSS